jgi:hypothetical protein
MTKMIDVPSQVAPHPCLIAEIQAGCHTAIVTALVTALQPFLHSLHSEELQSSSYTCHVHGHVFTVTFAVQTGKYLEGDETSHEVKPYATAKDFAAAVDLLLGDVVK